MKLRSKFLIIFLSTTIFCLVSLFITLEMRLYKNLYLTQKALANNTMQIATMAYKEYMKSIEQGSKIFAHYYLSNTYSTNYLNSSTEVRQEQAKEQNDILRGRAEEIFTDKDGKIIFSTINTNNEDYQQDISNREYFKHTKAKKALYTSNILKTSIGSIEEKITLKNSKIAKNLYFVIGVPLIYSEDYSQEVDAYMFVFYTIDDMYNNFSKITFGVLKTGRILIADQEGIIIAHNVFKPGEQMSQIFPEGFAEMKKRMEKEKSYELTMISPRTSQKILGTVSFVTSDAGGAKIIVASIITEKDTNYITTVGVYLLSSGFLLILVIITIFIVLITQKIIHKVQATLQYSEELAKGNFKLSRSLKGNDEITALFNSLIGIKDKFSILIKNVLDSTSYIHNNGTQIVSSSQSLSTGTTQQASTLEEMTANIEQITNSMIENKDNCISTKEIIVVSNDEAKHGKKAVEETIDAMEVITSKINVIGEITKQINLLALNASIEAARVSNIGDGFKVVSEEVTELADQSKKLSKEIMDMKNESLLVAQEAGNNFELIIPRMLETTKLIQAITEANIDTIIQISRSKNEINQISELVQNTAASSELLLSMSENMIKSIESLQKELKFFKLETK